jgi:hypothetical protein
MHRGSHYDDARPRVTCGRGKSRSHKARAATCL